MKQTLLLLVLGLIFNIKATGQTYTSYFTGNSMDSIPTLTGGLCLMGGATEDDNAMEWFLGKANGGDILVLRASGSDGYNNYMYSGLGVSVNSVETIVFNSALAANDLYIHQRIKQADGIWFAGGDQWDYISYWRNTAIDSLINEVISTRNIVIGGTSAGMAILGGFYFSAQNGTITSSTALSNPFHNNVTVDSLEFISNNYLSDVITDTHYDDPDRKGRHLVFLSRILADYGIAAKGIACDEYTAVCIDNNGIAKVYGSYPTYDDNAYFIQTNCELSNITPEDCTPSNPLDWNLGNEAIKVYKVKGTNNGANTFDLNDWESGVGGIWEDWHVNLGVLNEQAGLQLNCLLVSISDLNKNQIISLFPNPADNYLVVEFNEYHDITGLIQLRNLLGYVVKEYKGNLSKQVLFDVNELTSGLYLIELTFGDKKTIQKKVVIN
jgi:cyanophycinase-like exopeptidase